MAEEVSHKEIFDRLVAVEAKVDKVSADTEDMIAAFHAAQGAFAVLDWIAKVAKPILWIVAGIAAVTTLFHQSQK